MTRQIPDILYYKKRKFYLNQELLEDYFRENPDVKPAIDVLSTALWRGYTAQFEIRNNELLIKEIDWLTGSNFEFTSKLSEVFSDGNKFSWYSGLIRIDDFRGEFDNEPQDGVFEFLEILEGNLIQKRAMNYKELQSFKEEQYEYFMVFDDPNRIYELFKKNNADITEERVNEIIRERILYYTRKVYVD